MPQYNSSIQNAAMILSLFTQTRPRWGITEIAKELGFSKTTTYNLTSTLEKIEYLQKNGETQKFELGVRIASIGSIMVSNMELNQKAAGFAKDLASMYSVSCRIGIWDIDAVLITFFVNPFHNPQVLNFNAGPRVAAYNTALGRAILASMEQTDVKNYLNKTNLIKFTPKTITSKSQLLKELAETRSRGFSICNEEMIHGAASIGAPIFNKERRIAGAISMLGESDDFMGPEFKKYTNGLCRAAFQISNSLGYAH
jgi:DNA-binding IclR family transcriptional regulator